MSNLDYTVRTRGTRKGLTAAWGEIVRESMTRADVEAVLLSRGHSRRTVRRVWRGRSLPAIVAFELADAMGRSWASFMEDGARRAAA